MDNVREKLVELLDNFHRDLSPYAGNEKFFIVDDNIEQAEYLIDNGVTVQEWIPVSERLPTESGTYLVACDEGRVSWHFYYNTFPDRVTHWMPLPTPPKGKYT